MNDISVISLILVGFLWALFINVRRKKGWINASTFVLVYYILSFTCSLIMALTTGSALELYPTLLFMVGIGAVLWPIVAIDETKMNSVGYKRGPNSLKSLDLMSKVLAVIGVFLFFFYARYIPEVFTGDISAKRIAMITKGHTIETGPLGRVASFLSAFYLISMVLAFYRLAISKKVTWIEVGLILGTLAEVCHVFSQFGRDGVVFWVVSCILNTLLLWRYMSKPLQKKVLSYGTVFMGLFIAGFMAITISRFGAHKKMSLEGSMVSYYGQHIHNYADVYYLSERFDGNGYLSFPFFKGFTEGLSKARGKSKDYGEELENLYRIEGKPSGVFASFLREWTFDFGRVIAVLLAIAAGVVFYILMVTSVNGVSLSKMILYNLYCLFLFQGVFYFRLKFVYGNLMILVMVAVWLFLKIRENRYAAVNRL